MKTFLFALVLVAFSSAGRAFDLPADRGTLPRAAIEEILAHDEYPETTRLHEARGLHRFRVVRAALHPGADASASYIKKKKTRFELEEFDFDQPSHSCATSRTWACRYSSPPAKRPVLGPPGIGKTHLAIGLAIHASEAGYRRCLSPPPGRPARRRPPAGGCNPSSSAWAATRCSSSTSRLHPASTRSREPVLPARQLPLRTRIADRHQQQALRPLGRGLRRRRGRRRHDRPPGPPRRSRRPQRRQLPAQRPRPRPRPSGHHRRPMTTRGSVFNRRQGVSFAVDNLTVQTCPGVAVLWADVPGPSYRVCSWPWTWQQFWRRSATSASGGLLSTAVAAAGERMRACPRHVGHAGARRWAARVPSGL